MAKSYTEQLTEWVRQRSQSARHEKNRVAFLAVRNDVRQALEQGWPVKTIWAHMVEQERIGFGYDTFLTYVKRHVRSAAEAPGAVRASRPSARPPATPQVKNRDTPGRAAKGPDDQDQMPGFTFNAAPKREELI